MPAILSVLDGRGIRAFHLEAAGGLLRNGCLRLFTLRLDDRIIAVLYAMCRGRGIYGYLGGFDPAHARLSPGKALPAHAIEWAVREGFTRFDFLGGTEDYKYSWGAEDQNKFSLKISQKTGSRRKPA